MNRMHTPSWIPSATLVLALAGCSASELSASDYSADKSSGDSDWTSTSGGFTTTETVPETEEDKLALPPAQTDVYVFIPNPDRDTVTRLNVETLEVRTAPVGNEPTLVLTSPDWRTAVAFNRGSDSVTILDADALDGREVPVRDDFNQMVMSPDGAYVALWHDIASERPDDPPADGLQSFNECSFVHLATGAHFPMAVGFNPKRVVFTPAGDLAAVVADAYLAVVDLTVPEPAPRLIPISDDFVDVPVAEEVVLSPDGAYAFVRQFGGTDVLVVDLERGLVEHVPTGSNPTDLDLTPDGAHAAVVARDSHEIYLLDTENPLSTPDVVDLPATGAYGALLFDPTGAQAMLYTTAAAVDRYATWDLATDAVVERSLVKPVAGMAINPTGESLLVFHTLTDAVGADSSSPFFGEWALTVIALSDFRSNPLLLPAEPIGYANANNGAYGYFIMDQQPYLEIIDYHTLLHDELSLNSVPLYVGVLPDLDLSDGLEPLAWASQDHPLGRITLYDPGTGNADTITGFELNAEIED